MAQIVAIIGASGTGKSTSTIINPDGTFNPADYKGLNPKTHLHINLDDKDVVFPTNLFSTALRNVVACETIDGIKKALKWASEAEHIKTVSLDTINNFLALKEFNERKKMTYDEWRNVANDVLELNHLCNNLRRDQVVFIFGHTMLQTDPDGTEKEVFSVIGKKLTKNPPEAFYNIVLNSRIEWGTNGENRHYFCTKANKSSAKSPIGMFDSFEIPNSLALVEQKVRAYYGI